MSVVAGAYGAGRKGRKAARCAYCGARCYRPRTACACYAAACMPCRREGARPGCSGECGAAAGDG